MAPNADATSITRIAITVRVFIALFTRTFFQPDEYFQSLELAHHLVFGYGNLTWEWLAPNPIRSIVYPALNVPIYWLLKVSGLAGYGTLGNWLLVGLYSCNMKEPFAEEVLDCMSKNITWDNGSWN